MLYIAFHGREINKSLWEETRASCHKSIVKMIHVYFSDFCCGFIVHLFIKQLHLVYIQTNNNYWTIENTNWRIYPKFELCFQDKYIFHKYQEWGKLPHAFQTLFTTVKKWGWYYYYF